MYCSNRAPQRPRRDRKNERGSVLTVTALSMLTMLLTTGLAVDISHFYNAKAELQNAADASALAGASQLNSTSGGIKSAMVEATKALNKYDFKKGITLTSSDVQFATNLNGPYVDYASAQAGPTTIRFVKVTLPPQPVPVSFAAVALGSSKDIAATATAGLSVGLTMNKYYTAYTFIEQSTAPLVKGQVYTLSPKAYNDASPNSYRVLAGPNGDLILTGSIHAYGYIGSSYTVAQLSQAEMCRYAQIGMNTRFGDYSVHPNANAVDEPPDTITRVGISYPQYTDLQGSGVMDRSDGVKNRRVFTVPIASNTSYNTSNRTVVANDLAAFFVRRKVDASCGLEVEYIGAPVAVPNGTYSPGSSQMSDLSIPVLYK